jgi:glycosyltransferase involved in cell wall biosynthesis
LIPPKDPGAVAAAMKRLIHEPDLRRDMADRGKRFVRAKNDLDQIVSAYLSTFGLPPQWSA